MKHSKLLILLVPMLLVPCHLHAMKKPKEKTNFLTKFFSIFSSKQKKQPEQKEMTQNLIEQEEPKEKPKFEVKPKVIQSLRDQEKKNNGIKISKMDDFGTLQRTFNLVVPEFNNLLDQTRKCYAREKEEREKRKNLKKKKQEMPKEIDVNYSEQTNLLAEIYETEKFPDDIDYYADDEYSDDGDKALENIMKQIDKI